MKRLSSRFYKSPIGLLCSIAQLKRTEYLDKNEIKVIQEARFKALLRYTLKKSRFYKEYYQKNGVNIGDIDKINLKDLPTINKQIMMDNYDDFVCNPELKKDKLESFIADPSNKRKE